MAVKSFFIGQNPLSKKVAAHEQARNELVSQMQKQLGLSDDAMQEALQRSSAQLRMQGHDRAPSQSTGVADFERLHGDRFEVEHVERDGNITRRYLYRELGGGQFEKRILEEERAAPHTHIATRTRRYL